MLNEFRAFIARGNVLDLAVAVIIGAAFATIEAAMLPPAPGRFSMTTGWPHISESLGAKVRAVMSVALPGEKPTTKRTGCRFSTISTPSSSARFSASMRRPSWSGQALCTALTARGKASTWWKYCRAYSRSVSSGSRPSVHAW